MAKRNLNWTEIEARYKAGEPPSTIAKDYKDCSREKISQKATRAGWTQAKEEIRNQVVEAIADTVAMDTLKARQRALNELEILAYSDIKDYLEIDPDTGSLRAKGFEEMPDGVSRAIKKVKEHRTIKETKSGETIVYCNFEFELHEKRGAIMDIAKIEGFDSPIPEDPNKAKKPEFTLRILPQSTHQQPVDEDEEEAS